MTNTILGALVNGAIAGALLAVAVRAGLLLVPRGMLSAAGRYAAWWVALVAAVLLPLGYLPAPPARTRPRTLCLPISELHTAHGSRLTGGHPAQHGEGSGPRASRTSVSHPRPVHMIRRG